MNKLLTKEENECLDLLARAWNKFVKLPELHNWDRREFMHAIHDAQYKVLSRPAQRVGLGICPTPNARDANNVLENLASQDNHGQDNSA